MGPGRTYSVLVVEDERIVAKDLQQTLAGMGYDAFAIASSADEALCRASEKCPDLVLMDIRIKGQRDGIEAASLLRERFGVPVVYLTAHADEATVERAKKTEPYGYLMKPVKSAELRSAIEVSIYKHEMERRLRERERWFSTTLRSIGDAVVAVDLTGKIQFMNPAAETLTGVSADRAIGLPVGDVVRLLDPAQPRSPLDQVLAHQRPIVIEEAPLHHATSADRIISDCASPVIDDGQLLGAVMVFRDITEQKLLQKQLELADRLASLGTMAAGIAHQVNNPLAVVLANASFVLDKLHAAAAEAPELTEAVQAQTDLEAAARQISQIIGQLRAFARPSQPVGDGADVAAAVAWAARTAVRELRGRARLITDVGGVPRVRLDETRLAQVIVNLLLNAAHAIEPGREDVNTVAIIALERAGDVVLEVRDTGGGMSPDVLRRVFEPFFTARTARTARTAGDGTGLGLAVCQGIVASVGGRLEAESEPGVGSTFRVTLPTARREEAPVPRSSAIAKRRGRILVVDDEAMVLKAMARILATHDVVGVTDASDALARLARGERFDLIFSDVAMLPMSGMAFYERLLVDQPDVARGIVFLTGGAASARVADFLAVVHNVCLTKPVPTEVLRTFVQDRLARQAARER